MKNNSSLVGVEDHLATIINVVNQLSAILHEENKRIVLNFQSPLTISNNTLQEHKSYLYRKTETLMRIVMGIASNSIITNVELLRQTIESVLLMKRIVTLNNALLQDYTDHREKLFSSIMSNIDNNPQMLKKKSSDKE